MKYMTQIIASWLVSILFVPLYFFKIFLVFNDMEEPQSLLVLFFPLLIVSVVNRWTSGSFWPFPRGKKHQLFAKNLREQWQSNKRYVLTSANNSIIKIVVFWMVIGLIGAKFTSCKYGRCGIDYIDLTIIGVPILLWVILNLTIKVLFQDRKTETFSQNSEENINSKFEKSTNVTKSENPVDFWAIILFVTVGLLVIVALFFK